ncbi:hypothetical protein EDC04DRAFT_2612445 [Pisolithus marmoratus]|nr:hypothetical protein EDC04DRAFT_2612445 [Pisolithus marmoratus]
MIHCLCYLHQPIDSFLDRPNNKDMKKYRLSPMQWNVLWDFELILEILHQAICALSSECLPTLCKYLITFEKFYDTWIRLGQDERNPQLCIFVHKGLEWVTKYYKHMVLNPNHQLTWIKKSWNTDEYKKVKQIVLETMTQYHEQTGCDQLEVEPLPAPVARPKTLVWHFDYTIDSDNKSSEDEPTQQCSVEQELNLFDTLYMPKKLTYCSSGRTLYGVDTHN